MGVFFSLKEPIEHRLPNGSIYDIKILWDGILLWLGIVDNKMCSAWNLQDLAGIFIYICETYTIWRDCVAFTILITTRQVYHIWYFQLWNGQWDSSAIAYSLWLNIIKCQRHGNWFDRQAMSRTHMDDILEKAMTTKQNNAHAQTINKSKKKNRNDELRSSKSKGINLFNIDYR